MATQIMYEPSSMGARTYERPILRELSGREVRDLHLYQKPTVVQIDAVQGRAVLSIADDINNKSRRDTNISDHVLN